MQTHEAMQCRERHLSQVAQSAHARGALSYTYILPADLRL